MMTWLERFDRKLEIVYAGRGGRGEERKKTRDLTLILKK